MNTIQIILSFLGVAGAIAVAYFRKYYLPNDMASTDNESTIPDPPYVPASIVVNPTVQAPQTPQNAPGTTVEAFCGYIRDYEGKPGDLNYQLNNPGDCRPSPVGYLSKYEPVVIIDTDTDPQYPYHVGSFAKFPTYAIGWEYLVNLVHFIATLHPNETILTFFQNYAPSGDKNDPNAYAASVAKSCGVPVETTLAQLFG